MSESEKSALDPAIHALKNAGEKGFKFVVCIEGNDGSTLTCTSGKFKDDTEIVKFLQKFARGFKK